jgi:diguanylate cyclase (GGDEF)-like protein
MTSPVFNIQLSLVLTSLMIATIFLIAWKSLGHRAHALTWSLAFFAGTIYWLLVMFPGRFPSFESWWLAANAFGFILVTLGLRAHCQRTNCRYLPKSLWPAAAVCYGAVVWTTAIRPHAGLSVAILPFVSATSLVLSALIVIRHRRHPLPAEWAAAIMMTLFALGQFSAVLFLARLGPDRALVFGQIFERPTFLAMPAGFVGVAMFIIFMLASDLSEDMKNIAVRDQLTGLLNRRGFRDHAARAFATARRSGAPVSVIMTDLDHFKDVNDEFGHAAGDMALEHFAALLTEGRRTEDFAARLGGEEFALVLPGTTLELSIDIADELRERLEDRPLISEGRPIRMTASFGVATISDRDNGLTDIIVRADRALYRSKRAGRNRVDLESSQIMRAPDGSLKVLAR